MPPLKWSDVWLLQSLYLCGESKAVRRICFCRVHKRSVMHHF
jgi:hypothetical protein